MFDRNIFSDLLKSGMHSDIVISAAGGREFHAHKCILAAISPVLHLFVCFDFSPFLWDISWRTGQMIPFNFFPNY